MRFFMKIVRRIKRAFVRDGKKGPSLIDVAIEKAIAGRRSTVVQIGAHDGTSNDHLREWVLKNPQWRTILVEPVPFLFEKLTDNYKGVSGVEFARVAIGESAGSSRFYYVSHKASLDPELPDWATQLGSFEREHILKHGLNLEPYLVEEAVETDKLMTFLERRSALDVDGLFVDAEGFDHQIVSQLDFRQVSPRIILYEHKHISYQERYQLRRYLELNNYKVTEIDSDTLAVRGTS